MGAKLPRPDPTQPVMAGPSPARYPQPPPDTADRAIWRRRWNAMRQAHHPQGRGPLCGARIRYLIVSAKHGPIGGLAVRAAA